MYQRHRRLPCIKKIEDNGGRILIPLDFFYSENVKIGDEQLTYSVPVQCNSFIVDTPYSIRLFVWNKCRLERFITNNRCPNFVSSFMRDKCRLHRSTHDCFVLRNVHEIT